MNRGPKTEWMFRYHYPRPGKEQEHREWRQWLLEKSMWPSEGQLLDESYQMMMPSEWRRGPYKGLRTLDEFAEVQMKRIEKRVTWSTRCKASR